MKRSFCVGVFCMTVWGCSSAPVEPVDPGGKPSGQPYIDSLLRKMKDEGQVQATAESGTPFLDSRRKALEEKDREEGRASDSGPGSVSPYLDRLKAENPALAQPVVPGSYLAAQKERLGPASEGGAIAAVLENRSELHPRYLGEPKAAFGLRYGVSVSRTISATADAAAQSFDSIYGGKYVPELTLFFDREFLRADGIGSLGLAASLGIGYFHGSGNFKFSLLRPNSATEYFSTTSQTVFQFFELPATVGASVRLSLLKYLQPYAVVGPTVIGYLESRNDQVAGHKGFSTGLQATGGVAFLLDWISASGRWDAYATNGIHHSYLTVEYTLLQPLSGDVSFNTSGLSAGVTFEY